MPAQRCSAVLRFGLVTLSVGAALCGLLFSACESDLLEIEFADASAVWWTAPTVLAQDQEFLADGLTVEAFDVTTGLASKNAVISGAADMGLVAATPLALGALDTEPVIVLGSYVQSDQLLALVYREGEDIKSLSQNPESIEPIAIVPRTISEWYLHRLGEEYPALAEPLGTARQLHARPPAIPTLLANDEVNSASIWEPFVWMSKQDPSSKVFRPEGVYSLRLYLIASVSAYRNKKEAVLAFEDSVRTACQWMVDNPQEARRRIENHYGYEPGRLAGVWDDVDFSYQEDPESLAVEILEDSRIARDLNYMNQALAFNDVAHLFVGK